MPFDVLLCMEPVGYHPRRVMVNFGNVIGLTEAQCVGYSCCEASISQGWRLCPVRWPPKN
jgi:hypothetical protein